MATKKAELRIGDRVKFRPTHHKSIELTGTVVRKHQGTAEIVEVEAEPDGKAVEVMGARFDADTADVIPFPKQKDSAPAKTKKEDPLPSTD